jgi:dephospho-CoA kinase
VLLVGLTGGIGAGKSTVSSLLAARGAVVVDADQIARDLQSPGSPVLDAMATRFGGHIIRADGSLDRAAVAAQVFGDTPEARAALADLNAIVHPAMQSEIRRQIEAHRGTDRIVVLDFPLLGENPRDDLAAIVVVDVAPEIAVRRLVELRAMDEADARNRIASQISRADRLAGATHVVDNSGDLAALEREVDALWRDLLRLRGRGGRSRRDWLVPRLHRLR